MTRCRPTAPAGRRRALIVLLLLAEACRAEDIAPYKLTGVEGYATLQYAGDAQTSDSGGATPRSRQAQSGWRNEIFAMTHSYIYHPNLLTLDVGGGPVLNSASYSGDAGTASARGLLYNFSARATLLRDKPYTGDLFFSHLNPTISVAPGQVLTQENTRYGFDFSLLAPATPVPLQLGYARTQALGRGAERLVDDKSDLFNLTASRSFGELGSTQIHYQSAQQASQSGSPNLPIQASTAHSQGLDVDTRLQFGAARQYDLTNVIGIASQKYALEGSAFPDLASTRFLLDLRARHSERLHTFGLYSYNHSSQGELDAVAQSAAAGLSYWPSKNLEATLGVRGDDNATRQFAARTHALDGSLRYEQPLPLGIAQASYGLRYEQRSQQASAPQTSVLGEGLTLSGTGYVALGHPNVVAGSVHVSNAARTQTFSAGLDYLLSVVGTELRVQRLIGGNILDGEQVLVDYAYDVGGTYASSQLDQNLNLNWNLSRYVSVFYRRFNSAPRLVSGSPTFPLDEIRSSTYGLRADLPTHVGLAATVGGGIEFEDRRETVAPYRRAAGDLYVQTDEPLFDLGYFRLSARRSRIDYPNPTQNSDLRAHELRYWSRYWFGMNLTAALAAERDDGGPVPRRRTDASMGLQWQERKFTLTTSLVRTHESQGGVERDRTTLQFLARRDF